jgi:hypothetical protein
MAGNFLRGSMRIQRSKALPTAQLDADEDQPDKRPDDTYYSAILKLIPAEIVATFLAIRDAAETHGQPTLWFVLCLIACILLRAQASRPANSTRRWYQQVQWLSVIAAVIAFVLWGHAVSTKPPLIPALEQWLAGACAMLFGALAPAFVSVGEPGK